MRPLHSPPANSPRRRDAVAAHSVRHKTCLIEMNQFIRKQNRLKDYDYSSANVYLLTICTQNRKHILGVVKTGVDTPTTELSALGRLVEQAVLGIEAHYTSAVLETYSILPNHIHLLLRLDVSDCDNPPSVSRIVKQMKEYVTKQCGRNIWQKGFHDHVIRTERDYLNAWNYVAFNPAKWEMDEYYVEK